ncbi:MAG: outer membrane protein [Acidobacteriaceae bacterium]|jgi:outer membrane protein|nr:outer membrane protein [Acidobacteriaceae bacterium]
MALANNPRVSVSHLLTLAQHQVVRESRSGELPQLTGSVTAQDANQASRVASGSLSASRLFTRVGGGVNLSQLITDFGRTSNFVASSRLQERAQQANELATREDVVLVTDQAFYNALQAEALLKVAEQTVNLRQTTQGQINQLTQNKLRSTLDLTFANVNLSQAQLLQLDAQSNADASMAGLNEVLGNDRPVTYALVDTTKTNPPPPPDEASLLDLAVKQRPDLQSLDLSRQSQEKFSRAQADQRLPSLSAMGTLGGSPVRPGQYYLSSWNGAIGANLNVPIFNGFLYSAQAKEARLRAQATDQQTRQLRDRIIRDVQTAWLDANNAFRRIAVTAELVNQANQSLALAETRYRLGLSSIVELSQAQLQQTEAEISNTNAQYQYRLTLAALNFETGVQP